VDVELFRQLSQRSIAAHWTENIGSPGEGELQMQSVETARQSLRQRQG
jgi:hypothetical protein